MAMDTVVMADMAGMVTADMDTADVRIRTSTSSREMSFLFIVPPPYRNSHWIRLTNAVTPAQMPANHAALRLGQMGNVPVIFPVWPFMAKV